MSHSSLVCRASCCSLLGLTLCLMLCQLLRPAQACCAQPAAAWACAAWGMFCMGMLCMSVWATPHQQQAGHSACMEPVLQATILPCMLANPVAPVLAPMWLEGRLAWLSSMICVTVKHTPPRQPPHVSAAQTALGACRL